MKKFAVTLSVILFFAVTGAQAQEYIFPVLPVGCYVQPQPTQETCSSTCPRSCSNNCAFTPTTTCADIQEWKTKYFEQRCVLYTQLGLSEAQKQQARAIDEKFFDEVAPIEICRRNERAKYKEMKRQKCKWSDRHEQKAKANDLKDEIKDKNKQHVKCFEEILTPCQKKAYKKHKKQDLKSI